MASKMAAWRFNRKVFIRGRRELMLSNSNERFLNKCEQLNTDLRQDKTCSIDFNANDVSDKELDSTNDTDNDVFDSSNNELFVNSIDGLSENLESLGLDKSFTSEDASNTSIPSLNSCIRSIEKVDIAAALIVIKTRHSLSAVCVNDICSLLTLLKIPNAPRSWFQVKNSFNHPIVSDLSHNKQWICPACKMSIESMFKCSNHKCKWVFAPPAIVPNYFYTFNITDQISAILATTDDLDLSICSKRSHNSMLHMKDICNGSFYSKVMNKEKEPFITLTMSTDGIQPYNSADKSIWPVTMVINEIKRKRRFCFQNLVLGGIWPGPTKPKRYELSALLASIVSQLKQLEKGIIFECRLNGTYVSQTLKVFLICASMDKPAQSLAQNLPEPIALYGCGRCELRGQTVKSSINSTAYINCFPIDNSTNQPILRSNDRYDEILRMKQDHDKKICKKLAGALNRLDKNKLNKTIVKFKELERGILGPCVLRELKHFDVGASFVSDSLHNIYRGAFRKLLCLWLQSRYRGERWSCFTQLRQLSAMLEEFRFPSTTTRRPRSLIKFEKFKASELRVLLLFGFVIFKNVLKSKYYNHFLKLVVAVHLSEFRTITLTISNRIKTLFREFLVEYTKLYGIRHNQQVIHSLDHIGHTVQDYGPLTSYSTFHFENLLGIIMRTIKATRREELEMIGNLNTFRHACFHLNDNSMNTNLKNYLEKIITGRGFQPSISKTIRPMHTISSIKRVCEVFSNPNLRFFSTCKIGHVRFTTFHYSKSKVADDSAILFKMENEENFGLINSIFSDEDNDILFEIWPLCNGNTTSISAGGENITLSSVQKGTLERNNNYYYISPQDVIEKCVHWKQKCHFFSFVIRILKKVHNRTS